MIHLLCEILGDVAAARVWARGEIQATALEA